ncbi:MAG: undecaprenyldiphospho-muramoylpentapeptide beta-N-acetylglucosaminyltransferase [Idiomarina sp.]
MKQIMIAAAGTGGHVFPALAVAEQLRTQGWQVQWLGTTEQRLEARVVPAANFTLHQLSVQGLRGHGLARKLLAPVRLLGAVWQSIKLLRAQQAQLVLTFGGYVSGPAGVAARLLGIPLLVHEQNAVPGLTTRLLSRFAQQVMLGFGSAKSYLPDAVVTGNPLRNSVLAAQGKYHREHGSTAQQSLRILVVGGSLGARALNEIVPVALQTLQLSHTLDIMHQCGKGNQDTVTAAYAAGQLNQVEVIEFIDNVEHAYAEADLVICRSGALTVAEIAAVGVPALFVPLPHAVDDHQTANAQELVQAGAAQIIPQAQLELCLVKELQALLQQPEQLRTMAQAAQQAAWVDATDNVVAQCERWIKNPATTESTKSKQS